MSSEHGSRRRLVGLTGSDFPSKTDPLQIDQQKLIDRFSQLTREYQASILRAQDSNTQARLDDYFYRNVRERYLRYLLTEDYSPEYIFSSDANKVFFDLETLYLPNDPEVVEQTFSQSADYISKQRLGIAVSIDADGNVRCWDEENVAELIDHLIGFGEIVTYNGLAFDNQVLSGYKVEGKKIQELYNKSFDLMVFIQMTTGKRMRLGSVAESLADDKKYKDDNLGSSRSVPKILREGDGKSVGSVWKYTLKDVQLLLGIYRKLNISPDAKLDYWEAQIARLKNLIKKFEEDPNEDANYYESAGRLK